MSQPFHCRTFQAGADVLEAHHLLSMQVDLLADMYTPASAPTSRAEILLQGVVEGAAVCFAKYTEHYRPDGRIWEFFFKFLLCLVGHFFLLLYVQLYSTVSKPELLEKFITMQISGHYLIPGEK